MRILKSALLIVAIAFLGYLIYFLHSLFILEKKKAIAEFCTEEISRTIVHSVTDGGRLPKEDASSRTKKFIIIDKDCEDFFAK